MNWLGFLLLFAFWVILVAALAYLARRGKLTFVNLLPYQRGVLFRNGLPVKDVGSGKHRVWSGTELLVHADTRPVTVNYENQVVSLQDGFAALYGFSASAQVRDLRKVLYCARDYTQVPAFTFLRCARRQLNACTSAALKVNKDAVAQKIHDDAKARLESIGFELLSFRLTQFALGTVQAQPQVAARSTPQNQQN